MRKINKYFPVKYIVTLTDDEANFSYLSTSVMIVDKILKFH